MHETEQRYDVYACEIVHVKIEGVVAPSMERAIELASRRYDAHQLFGYAPTDGYVRYTKWAEETDGFLVDAVNDDGSIQSQWFHGDGKTRVAAWMPSTKAETQDLIEVASGAKMTPDFIGDTTPVTQCDLIGHYKAMYEEVLQRYDEVAQVFDLSTELCPTINAAPWTPEQLREFADFNNYVDGFVEVDLNDLISNDLEEVLDTLSVKLTGSSLLMDITYKVVGGSYERGTVFMRVSGDATDILEEASGE